MKLKELCRWLDSELPLSFQEDYDNSGLQVGNSDTELHSALLSIDVNENVVDEAVRSKSDIIISHHPIIFGSLKKITDTTPSGRIIRKCIEKNISIYSAHTNLDITHSGVSRILAEKLGLKDIRVLVPLEKRLIKLITYIPLSHVDKVSMAVFEAGAGVIGNYDNCGFTVQGKGSFRGNEKTTPFAGKKGEMHYEDEVRFETVLFSHEKDRVVKALLEAHPYEEVAYDLYSLENRNIDAGLGCTGMLEKAMSAKNFLQLVSDVTGSAGIRYSGSGERTISKVAVCGGSGASLLRNAIAAGADAFVTADVKYHVFQEAENNLMLVDAGHYETEKFAVEVLKDLILKKFPNFALRFSETNTNPINYF